MRLISTLMFSNVPFSLFGPEHSEQEVMVVITPQPDVTIEPEKLIRFSTSGWPTLCFLVTRVSAAIPKPPPENGEVQAAAKGVTPKTWDRVRRV
ncbi:MAG: hypothetical protein CM1200mP18_05730 [Gammaproteobacteria bacterium]|nr:MAG: hypothetical protein CM1200mP18_05730 [Gammaproteobacteria bacterium]